MPPTLSHCPILGFMVFGPRSWRGLSPLQPALMAWAQVPPRENWKEYPERQGVGETKKVDIGVQKTVAQNESLPILQEVEGPSMPYLLSSTSETESVSQGVSGRSLLTSAALCVEELLAPLTNRSPTSGGRKKVPVLSKLPGHT